jgi:hypothetical protein
MSKGQGKGQNSICSRKATQVGNSPKMHPQGVPKRARAARKRNLKKLRYSALLYDQMCKESIILDRTRGIKDYVV